MNLKNKKVLITGATGGIGNQIVEKFSSLGSMILATGTNEEKLNNLKKKYPNILIEKFKLDQHDKIDNFIEDTSKKLEGLDILVNNAGITLDNLSVRLTEDNWKKVIDVNLTSTFLMCKYAIKKMIKNKYGRIINITSIVGHTGNLGSIEHAVSLRPISLSDESKFIKDGINKKVTTKETINPKVIIQPKSIIGLIPLKTNDKNAHIVVRTVYKIGSIIFSLALITASFFWICGNSFFNCKNLTVKWIFIAILSISIKAIKFDEITVTFQPIKPNKPIIKITEVAQPSKGIITHFRFLKINHKVKIIKMNTPIPKTIISLLI